MTAAKQPAAKTCDLILDREAALAFVRHDHDFLSELYTAFQDYRLRIIERIECAIQLADAADLREAAHQLQGALGNFHARAAVHTAQKLADAGRQRELAHADSLCTTLDQELDVLCDALNDLLRELEAETRVD